MSITNSLIIFGVIGFLLISIYRISILEKKIELLENKLNFTRNQLHFTADFCDVKLSVWPGDVVPKGNNNER